MEFTAGDLIIAGPEAWDEACFAIPAVRALQASGLKVGVLCVERQNGLWATIEGLQVVSYSSNAKPRHVVPLLKRQWQASLVWLPGLAAKSFLKAKIPRRIGPETSALTRYITDPVAGKVVKSGPQHRVRFYLSLVENFLQRPVIQAEFFAGLARSRPPVLRSILLCPDSDFAENYEWPLAYWEEVGDALRAEGLKVTIAENAQGRRLGSRLKAALGEEALLVNTDALEEVLPQVLDYEYVVAADGSLPHVAAYFGATCITLFGPNDPLQRRPLGTRHGNVRNHVECAPCFLNHCPMDMRCQRELEVAKVLSTIREVIAATTLG